MTEHDANEGLEAIARIMDLVKFHMSESLKADGQRLQLMEAHILRIVRQREGCTQLDVVRETRRDKGQIGKLVAALVARGLLVKKADPDDGRRQRLALTPAGDFIARQSMKHRSAIAKLLFSETSPADAEKLLISLRQLEGALTSNTSAVRETDAG